MSSFDQQLMSFFDFIASNAQRAKKVFRDRELRTIQSIGPVIPMMGFSNQLSHLPVGSVVPSDQYHRLVNGGTQIPISDFEPMNVSFVLNVGTLDAGFQGGVVFYVPLSHYEAEERFGSGNLAGCRCGRIVPFLQGEHIAQHLLPPETRPGWDKTFAAGFFFDEVG